MTAAVLPHDEAERLVALEEYGILDTLPEAGYDDLALLASQICQTPISLVSLVDKERQWFKARVGVEVKETSREISFCAHAIHDDEIFEVPNASEDGRFCDNILVTGEHHIRFYAGAPLITPNGARVGTLCVIDHKPRRLNAQQRQALSALARQVVLLLELRASVAQLEEAARERRLAVRLLEQSNRELRASREEFGRFMDNTPILAWMKDHEGRFLYANKTWETGLGLRPNQLLGHTDFDWLDAPAAQRVRENDAQVLRENRTLQLIEEVPTPLNPRCEWLVFKFPIGQGADARIGGVALDLTELRRAEKLKNEFVSIVSHELRTPLTSIRGSLGLLENGVAGALEPRALEMLGIASKNVEKLSVLIDDLLDIEKLESGQMNFEMTTLDLNKLLRCALETNAPYAQNWGVGLHLEPLRPNLKKARVEGDAHRLQQVLSNLISNAVKYTAPPGGVWVRARRLAKDDPGEATVVFGHALAGERVRVEVRDEGAGVPPEFVPRLFERFAQADSSATRRKGGTGLGLAISRAIVEKHGARLGYLAPDAETGRNGATFFFELELVGS